MTRHSHTQCGILALCMMVACFLAVPVSAQMDSMGMPLPPGGPGMPMGGAAPGAPPAQEAPAGTMKAVSADPAKLISVFFSEPEREAMAQARRQFSSRGTPQESEADLLDQLQGIMASQKPEEELQEKFYAQFYLESLIYHTASDWMAWLKGSQTNKKFTQAMIAATDVGLTVVAVDKENITFDWKPRDWLWVSNAFKERGDAILLNQANRTVTFTLRTNQTFSAHDMRITEGPTNLTPVDAEGKPVTEKPLPPGAETATGVSAAPASSVGTIAISAGIMEQYKKIELPVPAP